MVCYCLTDPQGQIKDRDMLDLYDGYLSLGLNVKLFKESDYYFNKSIIEKNDIFCGHVNICRSIMKYHNIKEPEIPYYPKELKKYFGRIIKEMNVKEFLELLEENKDFCETYFVKPKTNKLFTGFCVLTEQEFRKKVPEISSDAKLFVSSEVSFGAEFRAYVYKNKIVDCFRYWGDNWKVNIPSKDIEDMANLLTNMPIFYSLDVGIDDKNNTLLIEINDGYALGNYGLAPIDYAKMSMERWQQIMS